MRKLILPLIILASFSSCKKYLDVNDTPNNPLTVPPSVMLPTTTMAIGFDMGNELNRTAGVLVQHLAGVANQPHDYDVYVLEGSFDNSWGFEIYNGAVDNLVKLIQDYSVTSPRYSGMAKLQLAYIMSVATDLWGDVPYSQAGKGLKFINPRFDKQQDIYQGNAADSITSLFDLVKDGMADLDKDGVLIPGKDDPVYGGKIDKWKRMGNTLLLKFAMQISNPNPALAKSTIDAVIAGNNYISHDTMSYEVPFGSSTGSRNPLYMYNNDQRTLDQMLSSRFLTMMQNLHDTVRLAKLFTKPGGAFVAFENGSTATAPLLAANRSKYNTVITGTSGEATMRLLTFAQVNFILAEAAVVLGTAGNANNYYQAGIKAHMQKIGMTPAEINTYFTDNPTVVNLSGSIEDQRKQIITQKYISWVGNPIEAYNDYRRTGYPVLVPSLNAQGHDPSVVPTRLTYPPGEVARNPNAPNPIIKTNVKVWWAK
jgi:hypothetical protein